jgi:hypothetical protein
MAEIGTGLLKRCIRDLAEIREMLAGVYIKKADLAALAGRVMEDLEAALEDAGDGKGPGEGGAEVDVGRLREWRLALDEAGGRVIAVSRDWRHRILECRLRGIADDMEAAASFAAEANGGFAAALPASADLLEAWGAAAREALGLLRSGDGFPEHLTRVCEEIRAAAGKCGAAGEAVS